MGAARPPLLAPGWLIGLLLGCFDAFWVGLKIPKVVRGGRAGTPSVFEGGFVVKVESKDAEFETKDRKRCKRVEIDKRQK